MTDPRPSELTVLAWGTFDTSKPRTRILLEGLRLAGVRVIEAHAPVFEQVVDKATVRGAQAKLRLLMRWLAAYPGLLVRFLRAPRHDAVLVGYMGQLDVLVLYPFAKLRRVPVVWDQFLSLYDTVVCDRQLLSSRHPISRALYAWEWLSCRAVSRVMMDTRAHARAVEDTFQLPPESVAAISVGAERPFFQSSAPRRDAGGRDSGEPLTVLFYGQFIPLHGVDTIVRAAQLGEDRGYRFHLVGKGQEEERIRRMLQDNWPRGLEWTDWVEYDKLGPLIQSADVCLGIFGTSAKAANVIPNKIYQIVACGRPFVTRDSPAIRELFPHETDGVRFVPPADAEALLAALDDFAARREQLRRKRFHREQVGAITPEAIGKSLFEVLRASVGAPS